MYKLCAYFIVYLCLANSQLQALTPDLALARLRQGNERYVQNKVVNCDRTDERRRELTANQAPFATILGCSDSRVPPEMIFDQCVGDLFVARVAGNVAGPIENDTIGYSVLYLGSTLIVVLGHENCGAVKAVLAGNTASIANVAALIKPAIPAIKEEENKNQLSNAIKANVKQTVERLKNTDPFSTLWRENKIKIIGAYYHFSDGKVEFME